MFLEYVLGKRLTSRQERAERVGAASGVALFGLDALGSAAYGPEAALTILLPAGVAGLRWAPMLSIAVVCILVILFVSYRQIIHAYPDGGGAYTVAGENLGARAGLMAGAALCLDYLLNVCVGISTGVGALVSAVPRLQSHVLGLCLLILATITLMNLRGARETGALWLLPTYLFIGCLVVVVGLGMARSIGDGGHPSAVVAPLSGSEAPRQTNAWMLIRAFAAGCTALTGVEAVSNGVQAFKEPREKVAKRTLSVIVATLAFLLLGISILVRNYRITATEPGSAGYQSVLSMLTAAVFGRGIMYFVTIGSILCVLSLSANTSFAGFPRLCSIMAADGYLPSAFTSRGWRLGYTTGIVVLAVVAAGILVMFGGVTDRLIPLFAVGAFMAFTLSQAGMVGHWRRVGGAHSRVQILINGLGAAATGFAALLVLAAKFTEGAWLTVLLLGLTMFLLSAVHAHHQRAERELAIAHIGVEPLEQAPLMLVPVARWNRASAAALQFACTLSGDVRVLHVDDLAERAEETCARWQAELEAASERMGTAPPTVVPICSPFRLLSRPIMGYIARMELEYPGRKIAVVLAETVAAHWYQQFLHNFRSTALKLHLFFQGNRRVVIIDIPWQLTSA